MGMSGSSTKEAVACGRPSFYAVMGGGSALGRNGAAAYTKKKSFQRLVNLAPMNGLTRTG
jgi:hypothetical protein